MTCSWLNENWPEMKQIKWVSSFESVLQVIFQPQNWGVNVHCFWSFKQIQDCPSDVRSADPTAKQIIRNKVSLQTKDVVQQADRLPIEQSPRGEGGPHRPPRPLSPAPPRTDLGTSPSPSGVSRERPLKKWQLWEAGVIREEHLLCPCKRCISKRAAALTVHCCALLRRRRLSPWWAPVPGPQLQPWSPDSGSPSSLSFPPLGCPATLGPLSFLFSFWWPHESLRNYILNDESNRFIIELGTTADLRKKMTPSCPGPRCRWSPLPSFVGTLSSEARCGCSGGTGGCVSLCVLGSCMRWPLFWSDAFLSYGYPCSGRRAVQCRGSRAKTLLPAS